MKRIIVACLKGAPLNDLFVTLNDAWIILDYFLFILLGKGIVFVGPIIRTAKLYNWRFHIYCNSIISFNLKLSFESNKRKFVRNRKNITEFNKPFYTS